MSTQSVEQIQIQIDFFTRYLGGINGGINQEIERLGHQFTPSPALSSGTTVNKFDRVLWIGPTTIVSAATRDLNMQDGTEWQYGASTASDVLGNAISIAEIVGLLLISTANSVGILQIGAAASNQWTAPFAGSGAPTTSKIPVHPNGAFLLYSAKDPAYAVTGSDKLLRLTASGGNVEFKGVAFGRSA